MYVYLYVEYTSHNDDFHTLLIHIITVHPQQNLYYENELLCVLYILWPTQNTYTHVHITRCINCTSVHYRMKHLLHITNARRTDNTMIYTYGAIRDGSNKKKRNIEKYINVLCVLSACVKGAELAFLFVHTRCMFEHSVLLLSQQR